MQKYQTPLKDDDSNFGNTSWRKITVLESSLEYFFTISATSTLSCSSRNWTSSL